MDASVAVTALDGHVTEHVGRSSLPTYEGHSDIPFLNGKPLNNTTHKTYAMQIVRETLKEYGISTEGTAIIMASWKPGTAKQYSPHISRWTQICDRRHFNPLNPTVDIIMNFFTETFHMKVGYECVSMARGALASLGIVADSC